MLTRKPDDPKYLAQADYCKSVGAYTLAPLHACWHCGRDIWERISLKEASETIISGCPYCHTSFCD